MGSFDDFESRIRTMNLATDPGSAGVSPAGFMGSGKGIH
jgi:hypothetical protein